MSVAFIERSSWTNSPASYALSAASVVGFGRPGGMIAFGTLEGGLEAEYKRNSIGLV